MSGRILKFKKGETIVRQGDREKRMYVILNGEVKINLADEIKEVELAVLKKNDFFGEISLFNDTPRSASAVALGNVELTYLDSDLELDRFLAKNPGFSRKMVKVLTGRLARTDDIVREELGGRSRAAMVGFLWD
jgi:CRP-like cAMP-binding protein